MQKGTGCADPLDFFKSVSDGLFSGLRHWKNRYKSAFFQAFVKGHFAISGRKDGVIFAKTHAFARPKFGAALTHDDVARNGLLATVKFDAETAAS
tara:strand:- start:17018 stop:17302 length:285 start_codon:yes stop_codon:yes gene_type:complete